MPQLEEFEITQFITFQILKHCKMLQMLVGNVSFMVSGGHGKDDIRHFGKVDSHEKTFIASSTADA
jgi:hypothetical protein